MIKSERYWQSLHSLEGHLDKTATQKSTSSEITTNEGLLHNICEEICSLKSETKILREELINIKQQKSTYANILSKDLNPTDKQNQPVYTPITSDVSFNGHSDYSSNTTPQQAINVVISDRSATDQFQPNSQLSTPRRPAEREEQTENTASQKSVLLMGDSIIHSVNTKGLNKNVHKHSVSGAVIKTLISDIEMYDLSQFHTVVLYIGGNDLSKNRDLELIEEEYDQLIALIKAGNQNCKIVLCKIAPRGDVDVNQINLIIERLSLYHQTECVDSYNAFHDRYGKILMHFLNENDHIHLSRPGTKRLLATIDTATKIVEDFTKCVFPGKPYQFVHQNQQSRTPRQPLWAGQYRTRDIPCQHCNKTNHTTQECRHQAPIKCWYCGLFGHKSDSCWY